MVVPTPASFAYNCNTAASTIPVAAAGVALAAGATIHDLDGCGQAVLYLNAPPSGRFQAAFAVGDAATGTASILRLFLLGPGGFLLRTMDVRAVKGTAEAVDIDLSGGVTLYDRVFSPSEPPISTVGGAAIDPRLLVVSCDVSVTSQDMLLIHQVALEQWSLYFNGCGSATLNLAALPGPRQTFSCLYGIALQDQSYLIAYPQLTMLDTHGKVVRQATFVARAGRAC